MKNRKDLKVLIAISILVCGLWGATWILIIFNIDDWAIRGTFGDMFGSVNSLFSGLALIGITYSIYLQIKMLNSDHDRRKKQATMEHIRTIRPIYVKLLRESEKVFGQDVLSKENVAIILADYEKRENLKDFLSTLEHLAVGVNTGIFDISIVYRMMGAYLIRMFNRFRPYIKEVQKSVNSTAYIEFENMAKELEKMRKNILPEIGNIKI